MSEIIFVNDHINIPEIFHSDKDELPFTNCAMCNNELLTGEKNYLIEKAYHQNLSTLKKELIFEFAYCIDCLQKLREEFSEESIKKLDEYFESRVDFKKRQEQLTEYKLFEPEIWLNNCVVKNKSIDEVEEYQIYALCNGSDMLFYNYPYMICGDAVDEVAELLSNKTLDIINDFWASHIDLPPEIEDIFKTKRPVIF